MNTVNVWLFISSLALALIALAGWLTAAAFMRERNDARSQRDKLNTRNAEFVAQNADLREALQDAQREIKALQMQTVEVPEVRPVPKRPTHKKAGT